MFDFIEILKIGIRIVLVSRSRRIVKIIINIGLHPGRRPATIAYVQGHLEGIGRGSCPILQTLRDGITDRRRSPCVQPNRQKVEEIRKLTWEEIDSGWSFTLSDDLFPEDRRVELMESELVDEMVCTGVSAIGGVPTGESYVFIVVDSP